MRKAFASSVNIYWEVPIFRSPRQHNKDIKQLQQKRIQNSLASCTCSANNNCSKVHHVLSESAKSFSRAFAGFFSKSFLELSAMPGKLIYFSRNVHMTKNLKKTILTEGRGRACSMKASKDIKQQQESAEMKNDKWCCEFS